MRLALVLANIRSDYRVISSSGPVEEGGLVEFLGSSGLTIVEELEQFSYQLTQMNSSGD